MKKVLVCGARDYTDETKIWKELDALKLEIGSFILIEGQARGADLMAARWAVHRLPSQQHWRFPADWKKYGRAAGPIRNKQMLEQGQPDIVLAFGGKEGKGTNNMVGIAAKAGIEVREFDRD